nr:uncharacterized protein LOC111998165 [Quercus suber]
MEVYVDDMLVKSKEELTHLDNLRETFATLKQYHMKLNPSKCVFSVASGKFLGFIVSQRGIEANLKKVQAIINMTSPKIVKEVQKLTGWVAALNRGGVRVVIVTPEEETLKYGVQLKFPATNNEAKYKGILTGLRLGKELGARNLLVQNDSKLVIGQIKGEYEAKEERMQKYLRLTKHLTQEFEEVEFMQIPRSQNVAADEVSKIASSENGESSAYLMMEV